MQARLGDWLSFGYRPLGNSSLSEGTISSGGDGNEHRAIAAKPRVVVWQNIVMALGIKGLFMVLGVVGLSGLWEAVFADVGVALLAVLNATRTAR